MRYVCEGILWQNIAKLTLLQTGYANETHNRRLWNARWQQIYQVNVHCCCSSEHAHITKNNGFYLVSLLPPSVPNAPYWHHPSWQKRVRESRQNYFYVSRFLDYQRHYGGTKRPETSLSIRWTRKISTRRVMKLLHWPFFERREYRQMFCRPNSDYKIKVKLEYEVMWTWISNKYKCEVLCLLY